MLDVRETVEMMLRMNHDDYVEVNRAVFEDAPPRDDGAYAYTYYDGNGEALYHGYTTDAPKRATKHQQKAPWASWVESVRYRKCSTPRIARKLEVRLQKKVPSMCHDGGRTRTCHGEDWSDVDREFKINHVTGDCKLPGGSCDIDRWVSRWVTTAMELGQELPIAA